MHKLSSLRDMLLAAKIGIEPENISTFIDAGTLRSSGERAGDPHCNAHFRIEYSATLIIINYARSPEVLMHLVGQWYHAAQPGHKADAITFEAEILDHDLVDIKTTIAGLTDTYKVDDQDDGTTIINCANQPADPIIRDTGLITVEGKHVRS